MRIPWESQLLWKNQNKIPNLNKHRGTECTFRFLLPCLLNIWLHVCQKSSLSNSKDSFHIFHLPFITGYTSLFLIVFFPKLKYVTLSIVLIWIYTFYIKHKFLPVDNNQCTIIMNHFECIFTLMFMEILGQFKKIVDN